MADLTYSYACLPSVKTGKQQCLNKTLGYETAGPNDPRETGRF